MIEILTALLTPLIAILTVYIAYQQYRTSHQTLNLARFDRRMLVYVEIKSFLGIIMRDANVSFDDIARFQQSVADADFLFSREIARYMQEIVTHANKLRVLNGQYCDSTMVQPEGYNHSEVVQGMHSELMWLAEEWQSLRNRFRPYLAIDDDRVVEVKGRFRRYWRKIWEKR